MNYDVGEEISDAAETVLKKYTPKKHSRWIDFETDNVEEMASEILKHLSQATIDRMAIEYIAGEWEQEYEILYPYLEKEWEKMETRKGVAETQENIITVSSDTAEEQMEMEVAQ